MNATMTYADAFHQAFAHESDFLNFLKDIQSRSHWDRHPAHDLEIIALDEGDPLTRALHRQYPDVLTVEQVSELLGVCTKTVYAMIRRGELKKQNVGRLFRIPKSYLIEYLGIEDARQ